MINSDYLYIGIDPGKSGAIASIFRDRVTNTFVMPISGKTIDIDAIAAHLYKLIHMKSVATYNGAIVCVEKVHAMPGQGTASMFSFGYSVGVIHGIVTTLEIPMYLVAPQTWKKEILSDTKKDKDAAIAFCRRVYPDVSLLATERSKKSHSGIADAICLARYGSIKF
jgi:crossover junction endodeoxyribonuclease RuvC